MEFVSDHSSGDELDGSANVTPVKTDGATESETTVRDAPTAGEAKSSQVTAEFID